MEIIDTRSRSSKEIWSEETPVMLFYKDGNCLRISAERLQGGYDEVYLSKEDGIQVVRFIQAKATYSKPSHLIV